MNSSDLATEKKEIQLALEALELAENNKDIAGILDLLAEDILFVLGDTTIEGKFNIGEMLKEAVKNYISSRHVPLRIEVSSSGDMAWLLGYELNQRRRPEGIVETKQSYLIAFRKAGGQWKQVAVCLS